MITAAPRPPVPSHLTPLQAALAVVLLFLALWLAYKIGIVILRVIAGLLFLGLAGYGIWYLFIR